MLIIYQKDKEITIKGLDKTLSILYIVSIKQ
uniref:Uncharacterized protein n=1 Tax=Anguilla anguilla TaxID=7936 RepID=A0A0E9QCH5_ANGAN